MIFMRMKNFFSLTLASSEGWTEKKKKKKFKLHLSEAFKKLWKFFAS